ncbi:MAG: hypothetical protein IKT32_02790 [Clostridia bacterium]|nr:hypothetical protein [Clostridia bacterium]
MKNKSKKKRIIAFCLALLSSLFCFSGCLGRTVSLSFANVIKKESNFEFCILQRITEDTSFEDYFVIPGFGICGYINKKYGEDFHSLYDENKFVQYDVSSWPDVLSRKEYITGISCHDDSYMVFGLKIGDEYSRWQEVLRSKGFKEKDGRFYYGCIRFNVNARDGVVYSFSIYADSTNLTGVVF